jgi:N-acetylmuramoyl-L-alanine amidase CwlA
MAKYNIPKTNVVRHYDVSGKLCPGVVGWNDAPIYTTNGKATGEKNTSAAWNDFLKQI